MQLFSVSRRKKLGYVHGAAHKVYDNRLKQNFHARNVNSVKSRAVIIEYRM